MYLTQSNVIRGLSKQEYTMLREMCQYSNNLYNVAVYTIRQHYFDTQQFLRYEENYPIVLFSAFCIKSSQVTMVQRLSACHTIVKKAVSSISSCRRMPLLLRMAS